MKFKLVEKFDETRSMVQEYMYDGMDELNNASLEEYIQWFKSELTYYDDEVEQAVTDAYIEACDYGMIKGVEKTRLTSELKEYIESNTDIIDDTDELMRQCPEHLQHELKIVLSKLDESLTESVLEEAIRPDLKRFIEQHAELLDENNIEELYKQCPRELKIPLVRMLNAASLGDNIEFIKRATYLADFYDDDELINLVLSVGEHANDVFDAFDYIMNNWNEFFTDDMLNESLNEELLTEKMWVKVFDGYREEPFYFYATEKDTQTDVNTLLPIITGAQKGTYKQQLNKNIVKELSNNYKQSLKDNVPYVLGFEGSVTEQELKDNKDNIITITDRSLRRAAQYDIFKDSSMDAEDWLIHHRKIGEYNNDLDNIVLIGRGPSGSVQDAVAHAIHKVLEAQKAKIATGSFIVPIKQHNGEDWVQTNTIEITIK